MKDKPACFFPRPMSEGTRTRSLSSRKRRIMSELPQPGLLLIPDISGFTEFVSTVEMSHGQHITAELLEALMKETPLGMQLSEIEKLTSYQMMMFQIRLADQRRSIRFPETDPQDEDPSRVLPDLANMPTEDTTSSTGIK